MPDSSYAGKGTQGELAQSNGEPVALSALIDHGVRLQWHEAVAVVRDICQLLGAADPLDPVPDLRHIWICANGRMAIAPGTTGNRTSSEQPVVTLGRLLLSLVEETEMPVQLKIVALSAAATTPAYTTLDEFSNALAYFERPSETPIRPVYARWHGLLAESDQPAVIQPLPAPSPPPSSERPEAQSMVDLSESSDALGLFLPEKTGATVRGRTFPVFRIAAAAVVLVALIVAWSLSNRSPSSPGAARRTQAPLEENASGTITWKSPATEDVDLDEAGSQSVQPSGAELARRRAGPPPAVATRNRTDKPAAARSTPNARAAGQSAHSSPRTQTSLGAAGLDAPAPRSASRAAQPAAAPPVAPPGRQPAVDERLPVPVGEPPDMVYSSSDTGIEPPVLVRPKVSVDPPAGGDREGVAVLDVLVSESGQVESISLAGPARDYRDAMTISAVKTWRFRPGMRDGHPVRYLKRIWVRTSPVGSPVW